MFCVECGEEAGDRLVRGLCHECFRKKGGFSHVPPTVDFEVCVHCGARKRGEQWVMLHRGEPWENVIEQSVLDAIDVERGFSVRGRRVEIEPEDERNYTVHVHVQGLAEGVRLEEEHTTRARIKNATCLRCSRYQGGYFEGIVQLRADRRDLTKEELRRMRLTASRVIERIVDEGDPNAFVLKDEEVHGGLDVYVGTTGAGRTICKAIAQEYGGRVKEHPKLVGRSRDGQDMYRVTFAVRIPNYQPGEYVVYEDRVHEVVQITPKLVTLRALRDGRQIKVEWDVLENVPVLRRDEAKEAVVVSRSDGELQVLDPWTYATVSVLAPPGGAQGGDTIRVLKWEGELLAIPGEAPSAATG